MTHRRIAGHNRLAFLLLLSTMAGLLPESAVADDDLITDAELADSQAVEELVVTGSRLPGREPAGLITLDRRAIEKSGAASLSALIRDLPIAASGTIDEQFTQGFAPASASVNLRGMGVSRTLVLLNGRRLPVFPFAEGGSESFVDLNLIPLSSIERIEIVKDGASAIYGADAVAGVVNIITREVNGTEATARVSSTAEADARRVFSEHCQPLRSRPSRDQRRHRVL